MAFQDLFSLTHFWFMLFGFMFLGLGVMMTYVKKPKSWFLIHQIFTGIGFLFLFIGVVLALNLGFLHAFLGLFALILTGLVLGGGLIYKYQPKLKKKIRPIHIWVGRLSGFLLFVVVIIGLIQISSQ